MPEWTTEQQAVINLRGSSMLVAAGAGSGKTAVLVERIIQMICDEANPVNIDSLLIVTFTNAAAAEMKERIGAAIHVGLPDAEARKQILTDALNDVSLGADVDIDKLVELTEGYSGAELFHRTNGGGICNEARKFAARRWIQRRTDNAEKDESSNVNENIVWSDFENALNTVVPVSKRDIELIRKNENFIKHE